MTISGSGTDVTTNKYVYDAANRQMEMMEGFGSSVEADTFYTYDKMGNLKTVTDPRTDAIMETYTYDARYRMTSETDGAGDTSTYTYDASDNVTSVNDPLHHVTSYTYDELNDVLSVDETASGGGVTYYVYDGNRNKIAQQDPDGNLVVYHYDPRNELTDVYQSLAPGGLVAGSTRSSVEGTIPGDAHALAVFDMTATATRLWLPTQEPNDDDDLRLSRSSPDGDLQ